MSKKKQREKRKKRSVAAATRKRREDDSRSSSFLNLPEGMKQFKFKAASPAARVDIIPYDVGKGNPKADEDSLYWERTFYIHRNIGPNQEWVVCPARTINKPCPICEYRGKLSQDPDAEEEVIKALNPSRRMIMNVIDKDSNDGVVKIWESSQAYFGKALNEALDGAYEDDEDNMDNFCDPEDGHYLKLVVKTGWKGAGFEVTRVDFKARKEDLDNDVLEEAACLDDLLVIKPYKELKKLLMEDDDDEENDDDEDETKSKKKSKSKSKKKKDEEEEEYEDDDSDLEDEYDPDDDNEEEFEEEEEDDPPKKKSKSKKKKQDEDEKDEEDEDEFNDDEDNSDEDGDDIPFDSEDDDEEEGDDDEEEDESPKKKGKKSSKGKSKKSSKKNAQQGKERSGKRRTK